jgi:uncharacterized protein (DUF433 family)
MKFKTGAQMTGRIEIDPAVMLGKPVIRNTRIPVDLILRSWQRERLLKNC